MAKWKLKATKEEIDQAGEQQGDFVQAPVGYYVCEIVGMSHGPNKDETGTRAEVVLKPRKGFKDGETTTLPEDYGQVWDYISDSESSGFKRAQFGLALGLTVKRGQIQEDIEMEPNKPGTVISKMVLCRFRKDTDQEGNYRPRVAAYLPKDALEGASEADESEVEEAGAEEEEAPDWGSLGEEADAEGEDSEAAATLTAWAAEAELDPDEYETWVELATALEEWYNSDGEEEGEAESPEDYYTKAQLEEMDKAGLTEAAGYFDLDINEYIKKHKGNAKVKLIEDILAAQGADGDGEAEGEEDPF